MKIKLALSSRPRRKQAGFSLIEASVGMGVVGTVVGAMLSGMATGTLSIRMARENLRATQIMLEKVETIRLYSWDQVTNSTFIPTTFAATYDPHGAPNVGLTYNGTMTISPAPIDSSYSNNLRMVTVHLSWQTAGLQREREFSSYIARNGLQDYIY
jgi:type II secretory pathway pseudopilin PulG